MLRCSPVTVIAAIVSEQAAVFKSLKRLERSEAVEWLDQLKPEACYAVRAVALALNPSDPLNYEKFLAKFRHQSDKNRAKAAQRLQSGVVEAAEG